MASSDFKYDVSVVIPSYKAEKTIFRTVESIYSQLNCLIQVIVIEDGIFDHTKKQLKPFLKLENFTLISNEVNKGGQYARNLGLDIAKGEYVMFMDSDDYLEGNVLSFAFDKLKKEQADICFLAWLDKCSTGQESNLHSPLNNFSAKRLAEMWIYDGFFAPPAAIIWRKDFARKIGGWLPGLKKNQDGEFAIRGLLHNPRIVTSDNGYAVYWHDSSLDRVSLAKPDVVLGAMKLAYLNLSELILSNLDGNVLASMCYQNARFAAIHNKSEESKYWLKEVAFNGTPKTKSYPLMHFLDKVFGIESKEKFLKKMKFKKKQTSQSCFDFRPHYQIEDVKSGNE